MERASLSFVPCQGVKERENVVTIEGEKLWDQGASEQLERREDKKQRKGLGHERLERRKGVRHRSADRRLIYNFFKGVGSGRF